MAAQGDGSSPCCTRKELAHDGKLLFSGRGLTGRTLTVVAPDGAETGFAAGQALRRLLPLFWVVLGWELAIVFLQMFSTGSIRRRLRPLNELAIKAEMLSGSEDSEKMEHLRQAISSVSANAAEVQVCNRRQGPAEHRDRHQQPAQKDAGGPEAADPHRLRRLPRSDDTRTSSTGGSGLGLSIAKWIINAHAGTVEVLSRLDLGTRFTVTFPSA